MGYRLKDAELQQTLDKISEGEFSETLAQMDRYDVICLKGWGFRKLFIEFTDDQIEEVTDDEQDEISELDDGAYNPHGWNNYPEVTPPIGVWMRCEWLPADGKTYRFVKKYTIDEDGNGYWTDGEGDWDYSGDDVDRFRPWDD